MAGEQVIQYRDDLVKCFVDVVFYEDGNTIDVIAIGAVRSDGGEFYAVNQDAKLHLVSDWVRQNVLSQLPPYGDAAWMPLAKLAEMYGKFLKPVSEVWALGADYKHVAIDQIYVAKTGLPRLPQQHMLDLWQLSWFLGNPSFLPLKRGNALAGARQTKELYDYLRSVPSGVWGHGR